MKKGVFYGIVFLNCIVLRFECKGKLGKERFSVFCFLRITRISGRPDVPENNFSKQLQSPSEVPKIRWVSPSRCDNLQIWCQIPNCQRIFRLTFQVADDIYSPPHSCPYARHSGRSGAESRNPLAFLDAGSSPAWRYYYETVNKTE